MTNLVLLTCKKRAKYVKINIFNGLLETLAVGILESVKFSDTVAQPDWLYRNSDQDHGLHPMGETGESGTVLVDRE
jgi:hypothetical protein